MQSGEVSTLPSAEKRALLHRLLLQQRAGPLSAGQQWLWLLQQLAPGSAAYNFPIALRIRSAFDSDALRRSLQELLDRHAAFRTRFTVQNGQPVQVVQDGAAVCFDIVDTPGWSEEELRARVTEAAERPIDLEAGPVFRCTLFQQSETDAVLLLVWHHLVFDGWSLGIVLEELAACYAAHAVGCKPALPPAAPYGEFVRWQQRMLASDQGTQDAAFWRQQLDGAEGLDLVTDGARPAQRSYRGGSLFFGLGESLTAGIRKLAASEGTTAFVVLLAGFEALLQRITGQERVLVSFPVAGRTESRFARTAGYFINQVAVTGDIGPETTFRQLVSQTQARVLAALEHQDYHLSLVSHPQGPAGRERPRSSNVMFVLQQAHGYQLDLPRGSYPESEMLSGGGVMPHGDLGGLQVEAFPLACRTARFDLEMQMMEQGGALMGWLQYDLDLFKEHSARGLTERFRRILAVMADDVEQRIADADILGVEERQRLLEWNQTGRDWPPGSITELFERQARRTPEAVAARCGDELLTFGELNLRANRVAHWLRRSGARPQDIVGLCLPRSLEMLVSLLGIVKAGCVYLPLDPANPVERLRFMLRDSDAAFVITCSATCGRFRRSPTQQLCLHCDSAAIAESPETAPDPSEAPLLYVVYTSGSTGEPKGVTGTQRGALNRFHWMWDQYPFADGEVCAQVTTLGFVDAVWEIFGPLLYGTSLSIVPDEDVRDRGRLVDALERHGVTRITLVPSLLRVLLESAEVGQRLSRLRWWSCSGEALQPDLAKLFHARVPSGTLLNLYGCSEAAADSCWFEVPPDWNGDRMPLGSPIANVQVFLLDGRGRLVPPGSVGEIHIGGAGLATGYLGRPELTAERFIASPFTPDDRLYRTGDLGRHLPDGTLEFFGRADQQVKIRGHRVELGEVEAALRSHPEVERAAVQAIMEPSGDRALVGYVVRRAEGLTDRALRTHLASRLPGYMLPSQFVRIDAMPLTATGKIDRRALPLPNADARAAGYVAPRTQTERVLAEVWGRVLNVPRMGVDDDFFEWGGHSILALQAASQASQAFKRQLPVALLVTHSTVATLAAYLDTEPVTHRRHQLVPIKPGGTELPLFWIPGGAGSAMELGRELSGLSARLGSAQPFYLLGTQPAQRMSEIESVPERAAEYVKAIRELQAEGPYFLAGFCLGGVIAFEVAQQLGADGQEVAFLGLLNSWMPATSIPGSQWLMLYLQRAVHHARIAARQEEVPPHRYLLSRIRAVQVALRRSRLADQATRQTPAEAEAAADQLPGADAILRATIRLASTYVPRRFDGKVHVFFSEEPELAGVSRRLDPRRAWQRVARDCEMVQVRGGHLEMLVLPLVDLFARQLRDCLTAARESR